MIVNIPKTHDVSTLNNNINKGLWIVWFFTLIGVVIAKMEHEWSQFEQNCKKNNSINVARVRDDSINQLSNSTEINGFPP